VHQLRVAVGDDKFFEILRSWQSTRRHGNGSIEDFMALSAMISGKDLDPLFTAWLFTGAKPEVPSKPGPVALPRSWESLMRTQAVHRPLAR
jgi:aminopeptidase N